MPEGNHRGQSIVEYAILLGVVIAALLIMQMFIKRGYQGGLKDAADKMGDQFSAGETSILQNRTMSTDQTIISEAGTDANTMVDFLPEGETATGTTGTGVYSMQQRYGGNSTSTISTNTSAAIKEKTRISEYGTPEAVANYSLDE